MNLQAKLTLGAVLLETLIVGAISTVDLGNAMEIEFENTLRRANIVRRVASEYVAQALNIHTPGNVSDREKLRAFFAAARHRAWRHPWKSIHCIA